MKVLFDQNVPRNLMRFLSTHDVRTSAKMGWEELANGALLKIAEDSGFEILLTADQNLAYQQNLHGRRIGILVLTKNNWPSIKPHVAEIVATVSGCQPGSYRTIKCAYVPGPDRT